MQSGARGMGDTLAAKIERKMGKPAGWMDLALTEDEAPLVARETGAPYGSDEIGLGATDWAMLEAFQQFPEPRREQLLEKIRAELADYNKLADEAIEHFTKAGKIRAIAPDIARKTSQPIVKRVRQARPEPAKQLDSRGKKSPARKTGSE